MADDMPPKIQVLRICVSLSRKVKTYSICKASSRVGVKIRQSGFSGKVVLSESAIKSETIGAAKQSVLPDPVCDAMRKS